MNEYRGFPRLVPRPGAKVSVTIGEPITSKIQPLVDRWRDLAAAEKGTLGIGGEWQSDQTHMPPGREVEGEEARQRNVRGQGQLAGGQEEQVRKEIVAVLQEEVARLGERVEAKEGRFERGDWSHSRRAP